MDTGVVVNLFATLSYNMNIPRLTILHLARSLHEHTVIVLKGSRDDILSSGEVK
jgi:hypothetical protein